MAQDPPKGGRVIDSPNADQFARQQVADLRELLAKTAAIQATHLDQCSERERRIDERFGVVGDRFNELAKVWEIRLGEMKHTADNVSQTALAAVTRMEGKQEAARVENEKGRESLRAEVREYLAEHSKRTSEALANTEKHANEQRSYLLERINDLKKTIAWCAAILATTGIASLGYFLAKFGLPGSH